MREHASAERQEGEEAGDRQIMFFFLANDYIHREILRRDSETVPTATK